MLMNYTDPVQWILGMILVVSSLGVITLRKPVHASLSFLLTLFTLAVIYLYLYAQFIAVIQVIVYAGAILVIFMFVIILFQDAHQQISRYLPQSAPAPLGLAAAGFLITLVFVGEKFARLPPVKAKLPEGYGTVQSLGWVIYIDYFFPFEAVIFLFLVAVVGAFFIGRKVK